MPERIDDGGPAFPVERARLNMATGESVQVESEWGLSRRDYFAAKALAGWMSDPGLRIEHVEEPLVARRIAAAMFTMADAMIAASKEPRHG